MKHIYLLGFSFVLIVSPVFAKQWQSNFQQGVMEYFVDEGNGNRILLSCPDGRPSEISVAINGKYPNIKLGEKLSISIDGKSTDGAHENEDCRPCAAAFIDFYEKLRNAKSLVVSFSPSIRRNFSVANLRKELPEFRKSQCATKF